MATPMNLNQGLNILIPALSIFREKMVETLYPEIIFPEFVTVDNEGGAGLVSKIHFESDVTGDLDTGLIGTNTTSIDTVDVGFTPREAPIVSWAKGVTYTLRELEICARMGIAVDTRKLTALRLEADQTLQKVAFIGHGNDKRITGLLNNPTIQVTNDAKLSATLANATEGRALAAPFIEMFKRVLEQTSLIEAPDTIAMPALDRLVLATTEFSVSSTRTVLEFIEETLTAAAGKTVTIKGVPLNYANTAGGTEKSPKKRIITYINSADHVLFDIPLVPDIIDPQPKGLLAWQSGMRMDFGRVNFLRPESATYIDY
ncbi:major capsid family protein [Thorsellia anophelis]|uniref:DUF2184 domain-containing protein n=1 Tax=Thorsellia anophelis DSM 18579 TaxID=1123402 RepID=A0A1I0CDT8_9GAMM|nr:major capsid family protein [Thorsellia anophelis]SET17196.1 hypothetical protein SAMN02583745_01577 [Thorsellia anophelis DSM 18579]